MRICRFLALLSSLYVHFVAIVCVCVASARPQQHHKLEATEANVKSSIFTRSCHKRCEFAIHFCSRLFSRSETRNIAFTEQTFPLMPSRITSNFAVLVVRVFLKNARISHGTYSTLTKFIISMHLLLGLRPRTLPL